MAQQHAFGLSVCMIVRNEERYLAQAIESVHEHAAEICVVDTGSTDRTCEIARSYPKVRLGDFAWCDDFAAARNVSLDMARYRWILVLDADEWLPLGHCQWLLQWCRNYARMTALFVNVISPVPAGIDRCQQLRVLQNDPAIRYRGRSHAEVSESLINARSARPMPMVQGAPICILHEGYMEQSPVKLHRNLQIQGLQLQEEPDNPYVLFNLGRTYCQAGDLARALPLLVRADELAPEEAPYRSRLAVLLAHARVSGRPAAEVAAARAAAWDAARAGVPSA